MRVIHSLLLFPLAGAVVLAGCGAADVSGVRRDQRLLARRLADTRADVDVLRSEVARLRGQMQRAGFAEPAPPPQPDYAQRPGGSWPESAEGAAAAGGAVAVGGAVAGAASQGRWPSQDAGAGGPAGAAAPQPVPTPAAAGPYGIDLRSDLARGPEAQEYRAGLESFQRGDYPRSVQSLRNFVNRNRQSELAPYAHYWIGEAYFAQGKYYEAILAYNEILTTWPQNERVPAARLRQAEAFAASGDVMDARLYLKELIDKYPGTPEATEAKRKLRDLN